MKNYFVITSVIWAAKYFGFLSESQEYQAFTIFALYIGFSLLATQANLLERMERIENPPQPKTHWCD